MAGNLAKRPMLDDDVFTRPTKRPPIEKIWKEMNVTQLATTLQDLLIREQRRARVVLKKETVSLATKIHEFARKLKLNEITALKDLVIEETRGEWVVTFLASLELSRLRKLRIHQDKNFDPIYLELLEELLSFDTQQAQGFEYVRTDVDPATGVQTVNVAHPAHALGELHE